MASCRFGSMVSFRLSGASQLLVVSFVLWFFLSRFRQSVIAFFNLPCLDDVPVGLLCCDVM